MNNDSSSQRHRGIRSYVLRTGRLTTGQKRALDELWPVYGIDAQKEPFELGNLFETPAPVTLEIGFGNGENLLAMAAGDPNGNYLGIEVHDPGVGRCLLGIEENALKNVRLMQQDAVDVLRNNIGDAALKRVNLFFPDPWHKKRHHKRRIVQAEFIALLARKISPGGLFHVATDWPNYAEHIEDVMKASNAFEIANDIPDDRIESRFDLRGQRLGHKNWEQAWRRCSNK